MEFRLPITCPKCGHEDTLVRSKPFADDFLQKSVLNCNECGARITYGRLAPNVQVEPHTTEHGAPLVRVLIDGVRVDLDPQHAFRVAKALITLVNF